MKRHPALASLSRDHHRALAIALRLRRASDETAREAAEALLTHWDDEEKLHFRVEEEILLPAYAACGEPADPVILRMLLNHMLIRRDVLQLDVTPSRELVNELGARLAGHVRHEEDEVFPLIEQTIPEPALVVLGDRLCEAAHGGLGPPLPTDRTDRSRHSIAAANAARIGPGRRSSRGAGACTGTTAA